MPISIFPGDGAVAGLILAHGAGAGQQSPFMTSSARALAARGIVIGTFDFPYMAARRHVPDPAPVLERTWREVVQASTGIREFAGLPLYIGGKSMGGRIASQAAAANDLPISGLVFLGYPLHPPGKPQQKRDAHLPSIAAPMLFVQGTRDAFGTAEEIRALLPRLQQAELHEIEGGDHSFKVARRAPIGQAEVFERIHDLVARWIAALP